MKQCGSVLFPQQAAHGTSRKAEEVSWAHSAGGFCRLWVGLSLRALVRRHLVVEWEQGRLGAARSERGEETVASIRSAPLRCHPCLCRAEDQALSTRAGLREDTDANNASEKLQKGSS